MMRINNCVSRILCINLWNFTVLPSKWREKFLKNIIATARDISGSACVSANAKKMWNSTGCELQFLVQYADDNNSLSFAYCASKHFIYLYTHMPSVMYNLNLNKR
jgi:hypothetical protein